MTTDEMKLSGSKMNGIPSIFLFPYAFGALIFVSSFFEASTWKDFPSYMSALSDMIVAGAAMLAFPLWKRQQIHARKSELAEEVVTKCQEIGREIALCRFPAYEPSDLPTTIDNIPVELGEHHRRVYAKALQIGLLCNNLRVTNLRVSRVFGRNTEQAVEDVISNLSTLLLAFEKMSRNQAFMNVPYFSQEKKEEKQIENLKLESILMGVEDEFQEKLNSDIRAVEECLKDYLATVA